MLAFTHAVRVLTSSSACVWAPLLCSALFAAGCVDRARPDEPPPVSGAVVEDAGLVRCGSSIASAIACNPPSCLRIPSRCGNSDNPYGQHECVWRYDCPDLGNGAPYCIATGSAGGCLCVQRCQSDDQCDEGSVCNCTGAMFGVCVPASTAEP